MMLKQPTTAVLSRLPKTCWPSDIFHQAPAAQTIRFVRTPSLHPSGQAVVHFATSTEAQAWANVASSVRIGGEPISATLYDTDQLASYVREMYARVPRDVVAVMDMIAAEPMHSVLLRNIPFHTTADKLTKKLQRSYSLAPTKNTQLVSWHLTNMLGYEMPKGPWDSIVKIPHQDPESTSAWFLVRLQSVSEAMRLVRSWHRTRFLPQKFTLAHTGDRYVVEAQLMY